MFIVRTLCLITLIPALSLNTAFSRAIRVSESDHYRVPLRFSAVAAEDEFLKLDVEAKEHRLQKQREALIAAKSETARIPENISVELPEAGIILKPTLQKSEAVKVDALVEEGSASVDGVIAEVEAPVEEDSASVEEVRAEVEAPVEEGSALVEELTAEIAETEEDIKNLNLERLVLRLQQSDNPRIKASVEKYQEVIQDINAFETKYFKAKTQQEYMDIVQNFDDLPGADQEQIRRISKQFEEALTDPQTKELFFQEMYKTADVDEKTIKLLEIVGVEDTKLSMKVKVGEYSLSHEYFGKAVIGELFPDILDTFTWELFSKIQLGEIVETLAIRPGMWTFPFHSFKPEHWQDQSNAPWKLHVSGVDFNAWYIFKYTLPYFWANDRMFKVYQSIFALDYFYNNGRLPQTGKLLTIYAMDDEESKELAKDLNDLLMILGVKESHVVPVPNDVKVGPSHGVYGRYEAHASDSSYDRFVPWGDNLNADRNAECPFVQPGIDIKWEKDGEVLVPSWGDRPSTWYKVPSLKADFSIERGWGYTFSGYLNGEGRALYDAEHGR